MSFKSKLTAFLLVIMISMGGGVYISNRYHNSKNKDYNEMTDKLSSGESYSEIVLDSLKTSFNEYGKFEVLNGSLKIKHTYKYTEDPITFTNIFTGKEETIFEPTIIKSGSANVLFDFDIESLAECEVSIVEDIENNKTIFKILVPYPKLDVDSVRREKDSFNLDEANSSISFSAKVKMIGQSIYTKYKETMDARATRGLEDSIDKISVDRIKEVYENDSDYIYDLESKTIKSIESLVNGLLSKILEANKNIKDFEVDIKLKESKLPNNYQVK